MERTTTQLPIVGEGVARIQLAASNLRRTKTVDAKKGVTPEIREAIQDANETLSLDPMHAALNFLELAEENGRFANREKLGYQAVAETFRVLRKEECEQTVFGRLSKGAILRILYYRT